MPPLFTKENITFILALFGALGAAYTFISTYIKSIAKIELSIAEYVPAKNSVILYMIFTNRSHLPISITDIRIWNRGIIYNCCQVPQTVATIRHNGKQITNDFEYLKSLSLPITLPSLSGTSGYVYFLIPQENFVCDAKNLTVELSTNRRLKLQKTLALPLN